MTFSSQKVDTTTGYCNQIQISGEFRPSNVRQGRVFHVDNAVLDSGHHCQRPTHSQPDKRNSLSGSKLSLSFCKIWR